MGLLLILFFLLICLLLLIRNKDINQPLSALEQRWFLGIGLTAVLITILFSVLLPIEFADGHLRFSLFTAVPLILAASLLPRRFAVVVGFIVGSVLSFAVTGGIFDIFHFGIAAFAVSVMMRQSYDGRFYDALRNPLVAGLVGMGLTAVLTGFTLFFHELEQGQLVALDKASFVFGQTVWLRLLEGVSGGAIAWIILRWLPEIQPRRQKIIPPTRKSIRHKLLMDLVLFAVLLSTAVLTLYYLVAVSQARKLVLNQMANIAQLVSEDIPDFYNNLDELATTLAEKEVLIDGTPEQQSEEVADLYKSASDQFSKVMLVNSDQSLRLYYPQDEEELNLSRSETAAVERIFATNQQDSEAVLNEEGELLSFIIPIANESGETAVALIGRVPQLQVNRLIAGVYGPAGNSNAFIVNEDDRIIAHVDERKLEEVWQVDGRPLPVTLNGSNSGAFQQIDWSQNQRQLVYFTQDPNHPWTVVVTTPNAVALNLAVNPSGPILLILLLATVGYAFYQRNTTEQIIRPLQEMAHASTAIAQNRSWVPTPELARREDEVGQLSHSLETMQKSVRQRISDLSLLLAVSQEVSLNLSIDKGMPALLRGILRGTNATVARAVIINPFGSMPLTFGAEPAQEGMEHIDRELITRLRYEQDLQLNSRQEIQARLGLDDPYTLPLEALMAISLYAHERFQGVLWLGYNKAQTMDPAERRLLNTLSNQAALLAYNTHLFAQADSGRRRLYAVLASTREPVIVTDPTERILIINPAFAALFGLKSVEVRNQRIENVIKSEALRLILTGEGEHHKNVEIEMEDGRIFYASASSIVDNQGQRFGRVAVLHDITQLKEIDELKSDFVQTVSHDLKNPLTFMLGYVAMLPMAGEINEKQSEYIDKIENGIQQMTQLVTDLLDLGRIEAGVDFEQEEIEILPLMTTLFDEYRQHALMAGTRLKLDVQPNIAPIRGDLSLIRQALTNLVGNSIKYAPQSGDIYLRAKESNGEVVISIKDNGPGIPEKDQIRLFEKFYRVKQPGTERIKGSGLGLAIVKSIAERHGGRAGCYSKSGEGATFYIALPAHEKKSERPLATPAEI